MSMKTLETAILKEAKIVTKNNKLRQKDIMEWSTGKVKAEDGEAAYFLPELRINIAVAVKEKSSEANQGNDERGNRSN